MFDLTLTSRASTHCYPHENIKAQTRAWTSLRQNSERSTKTDSDLYITVLSTTVETTRIMSS